MCVPEGRKNNLESVRLHKNAGCLISFDPNLRENLWADLATATDAIREGLELSDVIDSERIQQLMDKFYKLWRGCGLQRYIRPSP